MVENGHLYATDPLLYVLIYARIPLFLLWVRKLLQVLEYGWGFC